MRAKLPSAAAGVHACCTPPGCFKLQTLACAVLLACCGTASANPSGAQVAAGSATFRQNATTLRVKTTPNTVINWREFSIGAGERTRFIQESASSKVLNRVVGSDASSILGKLSSNGRVFLINPNGIVFGAGAVINTAGFVASTLNMSDSDFIQGKLKFEGGGAGALRNAGTIRAAGDIMLVGPSIENSGLIHSSAGSVVLAAGRALTITSPDAHGVTFTVQAPTDSVVNLGTIEATKAVGLFAGTLRHSGDISVVNAGVDGAGRVLFAARHEALVQGGSTISAHGGAITIESDGTTLVSGTVDASGGATGGTIKLLGRNVGVLDGANVDASGAAGGGKIYVGGDYRGLNPEIRNALHTHVDADAILRADATTAGDGGRIIAWSDETTRVHGLISARGAGGGRGGFVETSGKYLQVTRTPELGAGGTWLLDPRNIEVVSTATMGNTGPTMFQPTADDSQVNAGDIAAQLMAGVNVILDTNTGGGTQAGNITVNAAINKSSGPLATLTFNAQNDVRINQPITLTNGNFEVNTLNIGSTMDVASTVVASAMTLNLAGTLVVAPVGSSTVNLTANAGQTITARNIFVDNDLANPGIASITNNGGAQNITVNSGGGTALRVETALGTTGTAGIISNAGTQNITVNNADSVLIAGRGGNASIFAFNGGVQTVVLQGTGANVLTVGAADAVGTSEILGFTQAVTVGQTGQLGGITLVGGVSDNRFATLSTLASGGTQSVTTSGTIMATGGSAGTGVIGHDASIGHQGSGAQTVSAERIVLQGGAGAGDSNNAFIFNNNTGGGAQTITVGAGGIVLQGGAGAGTSNSAVIIANTAGGAQTITVGAGGIAMTGGTAGNQNVAEITQISLTAGQSITLNAGGSLVMQGGSTAGNNNQARISASGPSQTITFNGGGSINLTGGINGTLNIARIRAQAATSTQTITGVNGITLTGGASGGGVSLGNFAQIQAFGDQDIIVGAGGINLFGGGGTATQNFAQITQTGVGAFRQDITLNSGGSIQLVGGSSAGAPTTVDGSFASLRASGTRQFINFAAGGDMTLTGGTVGASNFANIQNVNNAGVQTVTGVNGITLTGGASGGAEGTSTIDGAGNSAQLRGNGSQEITAGTGGLTARGGSGNADNFAQVRQGPVAAGNAPGPGTHQTITVTNGGNIVLEGGSSTAIATPIGIGSFGRIRGEGDNQDIIFTAGGSIMITGGSVGSSNHAQILTNRAAQTITGAPNLTMTAGTSGGAANDGNFARIRSGGTQDLALGTVQITGSGGGIDNFATIDSPTQTITTSGPLTLNGPTGGTGSRGARIGGFVDGPTNLILSVAGDINVNGGTVAGSSAIIGASGNSVVAQPADITINATGGVFLNAPGAGESRIGHAPDLVAGGTISVTAGGDIVLAGGGGGGNIRTTGNVALQADAAGGFISQGTGSAILASALIASADAGISLAGANLVNSVSLSVADPGGTIAFNNAQSLALLPTSIMTPAGAQTVVITTSGAASDILVAGAFDIEDDFAFLSAGRDIIFSGGTSLTGVGSAVFTGAGTAQFPSGFVTLDSTVTFALPVNIAAGATVNLTGAGATTVSGPTTLTNAGALNLAGTGNLILNHGTVFSNTGTFDIQTDADVQTLAGPASTIANSGLIVKSGGAGVSELGAGIPLTIQNASSGILHVKSGTLQANGGFPSSSGTLRIDAGATFSTNGAALTNTGTLVGGGTLDLAGNTLTNSGRVMPGSSPGTMVIAGNYTQDSAGTLEVEVGGPVQGVSYDLLQVTGIANLGGTLQIVQSGSFNPSTGQTFDFLTYASRTGDFQTVNSPSNFRYEGTPGPTAYTAVARAPNSVEGILPPEQARDVRMESTNQVLVLSDASTEQTAESSDSRSGGGTGGGTKMTEAEADKAPRAAATECR